MRFRGQVLVHKPFNYLVNFWYSISCFGCKRSRVSNPGWTLTFWHDLWNYICMIFLTIDFVYWFNNFYNNITSCVNSGWKPRAVIMFAFLGFSWKASFRHYHYQLIVLIIYFFSSVCDYWLEQSDDKQTNKRIRESQLQLKKNTKLNFPLNANYDWLQKTSFCRC